MNRWYTSGTLSLEKFLLGSRKFRGVSSRIFYSLMQIFLEVFILDLLFNTAKQLFADIINSINPSSMRSTSSKLVVIGKFNLLNTIFPRVQENLFKMFCLLFSVVTILCNFQFARPLTDSYSQKTQSTP